MSLIHICVFLSLVFFILNNVIFLKDTNFNYYIYIYIYLIFSINLVSQVTLRSSGTDILYGCHLQLSKCIKDHDRV